jgi:hypothetical protein
MTTDELISKYDAGIGLDYKEMGENVIATGWNINVYVIERCISNKGMSQEVKQIREEYEVRC